MAKRQRQNQTKRPARATAPGVPAPPAEPRPKAEPRARPAGRPGPVGDTRATGLSAERAARKGAREAAIKRDRLMHRVRNWGIGAAIVGAIAVVLVISGAFEPDIGTSQLNEGGVGAHIPDTAELTQKNRPPSSGPHYAARASYGLATEPVKPGNWVHALEHGGVVVLYKCADPTECSAKGIEIRSAVYDRVKAGRFGERKMVITPYQEMDAPITAVAWGRILAQETLNADQVIAFYNRYVDKGPENAA